MKLRLHVAYEGTRYCGWQFQPDATTVEGELTRAAATILDRPEPEVTVQGASRTDSGVHALGQVAHLCVERDREPWDFARGLNALTDDDICVNRVEEAPEEFHARHSARGKTYRYEIWNHRFQHPLDHRRTWQYGHTIDLKPMQEAAAAMVGRHDFEAFRASDCQNPTTIRTMKRVDIECRGSRIAVTVEGTRFLKYMVRVMVGTLVEIGNGQLRPSIVPELFETGDRDLAGITAPPDGLTLRRVHYPDFPWKGGEPDIGAPCLAEEGPGADQS